MIAQNLVGKRFGCLTVVKRRVDANINGHGQGRAWMCVCTCGGWAIRTTVALKTALKLGRNSMCSRCLKAVRSESHDKWRKSLHTLKTMGRRGFRETDQYFDDDLIIMDVLEALIEKFGPVQEEGFTNEQVDPWFTERTPWLKDF